MSRVRSLSRPPKRRQSRARRNHWGRRSGAGAAKPESGSIGDHAEAALHWLQQAKFWSRVNEARAADADKAAWVRAILAEQAYRALGESDASRRSSASRWSCRQCGARRFRKARLRATLGAKREALAGYDRRLGLHGILHPGTAAEGTFHVDHRGACCSQARWACEKRRGRLEGIDPRRLEAIEPD